MFRSDSSSSSPAAPNYINSANYANSGTLPAELSCFLCKNIFNEPLILSCGHTFCQPCLRPWLRRATICPFCRSPTLQPVRNTSMAQRVADFRKLNSPATKCNNFIRNAIRRTMHPSKEAKFLQREVVRASQRRPKNVVLPEKTETNVAHGQKADKEAPQQQFPRMGNLRKSFARIRNKFGSGGGGTPSNDQKQRGSPADERSSVHSFQSAVTRSAASSVSSGPGSPVLAISAAGPDHRADLALAFAAHLDQFELIELAEGKKSPSDLITAIGNAQRVVLIYRIDQRESFEQVRKVFEYYSPETMEAMKRKAKFVLIGLNVRSNDQRLAARKVDRSSGEKLAKQLGTRLSEIELAVLGKTFPIWFHPLRPNLAPDQLIIRSPVSPPTNNFTRPSVVHHPAPSGIPVSSTLRHPLPPPPPTPRPILQLLPPSQHRSLISSTSASAFVPPPGVGIRPAMGMSASALRRSSAGTPIGHVLVVEKKEKKAEEITGGGGGCVLM